MTRRGRSRARESSTTFAGDDDEEEDEDEDDGGDGKVDGWMDGWIYCCVLVDRFRVSLK